MSKEGNTTKVTLNGKLSINGANIANSVLESLSSFGYEGSLKIESTDTGVKITHDSEATMPSAMQDYIADFNNGKIVDTGYIGDTNTENTGE